MTALNPYLGPMPMPKPASTLHSVKYTQGCLLQYGDGLDLSFGILVTNYMNEFQRIGELRLESWVE